MSDDSVGRFRRVDALFDQALDVPQGERAALVERATAGDPDVRAAVMRLLEAHAASGDFLESAAVEVAAPLLPDGWVAAVTPDNLGPFRVVREIGRGGMGTVFLGERADGEFEQRVALKLLRALAGTTHVHSHHACRPTARLSSSSSSAP